MERGKWGREGGREGGRNKEEEGERGMSTCLMPHKEIEKGIVCVCVCARARLSRVRAAAGHVDVPDAAQVGDPAPVCVCVRACERACERASERTHMQRAHTHSHAAQRNAMQRARAQAAVMAEFRPLLLYLMEEDEVPRYYYHYY